MKKLLVILIATVTLGTVNKASAQVYGGISFNTFYNELSPYGRWVYDAQYGQVWLSDAPGFEPYYNNGHWVFTSYGWTWVSDYAWGWAPFHYGRWTYLPTWGWAWVPGYEWGPAWVGWCQNDGYFGWAPLGPGMGFNFSYNSVPRNYWRFVQQRYITEPAVGNHIIRPERNRNQFNNVTIINNTQVNNNITYAAGPKKEAVERIIRQKIDARPVAFTGINEGTRVEQKQVSMYRPDLKTNTGTAGNHQPANLEKDQLQQNGQLKNAIPNTAAVKPLPATAMSPSTTVQPQVKQNGEQQVNRDNDRRIKPLPATTKQDAATAMDEPAVSRHPNRQEAISQQGYELNTVPQNTQRQNDLRLQRVQEQQMKEQQIRAQQEQQQRTLQQQNEQQRQIELNQQRAQQQEQLRQQLMQDQKIQQQQAIQQQNEQRQIEARQLQLREQQAQQQWNLQQQQNEMRQQQQEQRAQQQRMMQQQNQQRQNEMRQQRMEEAAMRPQRQAPVYQRSHSGKSNEN